MTAEVVRTERWTKDGKSAILEVQIDPWSSKNRDGFVQVDTLALHDLLTELGFELTNTGTGLADV